MKPGKTKGARSSRLTPRQQRFIAEYLIDLNATQAAIRAGYSKRTASAVANETLRNPLIASTIKKAIDARAERTQVTADQVLAELAIIGFSDVRNYVVDGVNGVTLAPGAPDVAMRAVASMKVRRTTDADGNETVTSEYRLWDKPSALDKIGKHLGMFVDKIEHSMNGSLAELIASTFGKPNQP